MIKSLDLTPDQNRALEHAISDELSKSGRDIDVEVTHVQDEGDCMKAFYAFEDPKTNKERQGSIYFTARILDHNVEDFQVKNFNESVVNEKVHTIGSPYPKRGAPTGPDRARAFDKVNARTGKRPDRSFLKNYNPSKGKYSAIEFSDEEDFIMVLVMGDGKEFSYGNSKDPWSAYYGVNVLFFPDGKIDADYSDPTSKAQWHKDKEKIIKVAKDSLKDKDLPGIYDGLGGVENKRGTGKLSFDPDAKSDYHGYHDKKTNEGKLSFKQFLLWESEDEQYAHFKGIFGEVAKKLSKNRHLLAKMQGAASALTPMFKTSPDAPALTDAMNYFATVGDLLSQGAAEKAAEALAKLEKTYGTAHVELTKMIKMLGQAIELAKAGGVNEAKQIKIKEPGWYVVDHMDKPVAGPMQERGAKEEADEMNAKHAEKHGKGDITPYSAEYYTDYEIRRMNEAACSDSKRLAKQDPEAIMKAKAEVAKARKSGDAAALEKAKKKLATLTEGAELSAAQKKALLADFEEWSGGFTPDDCSAKQVKQYIESGMSTEFPEEAAIAYLDYIRDNGASNAP